MLRALVERHPFGSSLLLAEQLAEAGEFDGAAACLTDIHRFWRATDGLSLPG